MEPNRARLLVGLAFATPAPACDHDIAVRIRVVDPEVTAARAPEVLCQARLAGKDHYDRHDVVVDGPDTYTCEVPPDTEELMLSAWIADVSAVTATLPAGTDVPDLVMWHPASSAPGCATTARRSRSPPRTR